VDVRKVHVPPHHLQGRVAEDGLEDKPSPPFTRAWRLACATSSCRQIADQIVGNRGQGLVHGGTTKVIFRYEMGLAGAAWSGLGQTAALS
jgi:hypothetical protein